jgi:hypothetical protein
MTRHGKRFRPDLRVVGDDGESRTAFAPGESIALHVLGLQPVTPHHVTLADVDGELFTDCLITNVNGEIVPTVIWPMLAIDDPRGGERLSIEKARERWHGRKIGLRIRSGKDTVAETTVRVDATLARPLVLSTDEQGAVLNGFEVGDHAARVTLYNAPRWDNARVWMVSRQHEWRRGDPIRPVVLASGRIAFVDVDLGSTGPHPAVVAKADEIAPGAYDFVVRQLRYGYEDEDDFVLRAGDLIGGRRITGLVVRDRYQRSLCMRGSCLNVLQIAGRWIGEWPYMRFTDTFQVGENIYGALDPAALPASLIGKMVALYVVRHKTAAEWNRDASLANLDILGGNGAVPRLMTQSSCINANWRLLWPAASLAGDYDIVADFGNNTGVARDFRPDNVFDQEIDIIDGYFMPGFRVVADPTTDRDPSVAEIGSLQYDETTEGFLHVTGEDALHPGIHLTWDVPLKATVRFPADVPGATVDLISTARPNYPLVVLVHGNGRDGGYMGYDYLLDHLAHNGFIAASIHMEPNEGWTDRARVLRGHLEILFRRFGPHVQNNIGVMGHSRGGEAVAIATRLNADESWGYNINAIISLAPTDRLSEHLGGPAAFAHPYLVIYGSLDGDVAGPTNTGFRLYDRASGMKKSMAFVYRACHGRFNTVWGDEEFDQPLLTLADRVRVLSADAHHQIAMGYMSAFFRLHLRGEAQWEGIFRGEWMPAAVEIAGHDFDGEGMRIFMQYEDTTVRTVDDFEGPHSATSWSTSTIGGAVSATGLPAMPLGGDLHTLDVHSPHETTGLLLSWDHTGGVLRFDVPARQRNVTVYEAVSFRISQRADSLLNRDRSDQDLRLTLTDGAGRSRAIRVSDFARIPHPDVRGLASYTKSAMRTVRIPLRSYTIRCVGIDAVDLTNVVTLAFEFAETPRGEVEIDSVQFTA